MYVRADGIREMQMHNGTELCEVIVRDAGFTMEWQRVWVRKGTLRARAGGWLVDEEAGTERLRLLLI